MNSRTELPYREKTEMFLLIDWTNKVLAEDHWNYIMFPWGWIDEWETSIKDSAIRELVEETQLKLIWNLSVLWNVEWKWFVEWANNDKRRKRYNEFQWEKVYHLLWKVDWNRKITEWVKMEEDSWKNVEWIEIEKCIEELIKLANKDHPNTYPYRVAQLYWLRSLAIMNNINLPDSLGEIINKLDN